MPFRILLISCSKRKVVTVEPLQAIDLYDGPYYRTLRKLRREGTLPNDLDVFIISAEYGVIPSCLRIKSYERKMDKQRAKELQPALSKNISDIITRANYTELFVNLGSIYYEAVRGYNLYLPKTIKITEATGEIGQRLSAMKRWILGTVYE